MEPVRCPSCNRSFVLIGVDDFEEKLELVIYCLNCGITLQLEIPKATEEEVRRNQVGFHHEDEGTGQYL